MRLRINTHNLSPRALQHISKQAQANGKNVSMDGRDVVIGGLSESEGRAAQQWLKTQRRAGSTEFQLAEIQRLFNTPMADWYDERCTDDMDPEELAPWLFK